MPKVDTTKCRVRFCPYAPKSREDLDAHVESAHRTSDNMFVCPECPTYTTPQMSNLNSHMAARHDPARARFSCPVDGCGSTQASQRHLDSHIEKKHNGGGYMTCPHEGCTFRTQYQNVIELHINSVHSDERPFECPFDGCDFTAKRKDTIMTHTRRHTGERPYVCNAEGCDKSFHHRQALVQHNETHWPTKPWLHCTMCTRYRTKRSSRLREHVNEVHMNIKQFSCPHEDCDFTTARKPAIRQHVNAIHEKEEIHTCPIDTCDFATLWPTSLQHHIRFNHTETGARVRNGQEYQFLRALGEHFDVQQPFAIRKELLTHCRRKFIHVDAAIALPGRDLLVLIECDEQQHKDATIYRVRDELTRMQDATQGIRASGENGHVLWVRFNPDTYTITSETGEELRKNITMQERLLRLVDLVEEFEPVDNETDEDMTVAYMFYDSIVVNGAMVATVTQHADYFEELKPFTMTVV